MRKKKKKEQCHGPQTETDETGLKQENKWSFIIMVKSPNHKVFLKFCDGLYVLNTLTNNLGKGLCRRRQHL